jgi:hypothetical protein
MKNETSNINAGHELSSESMKAIRGGRFGTYISPEDAEHILHIWVWKLRSSLDPGGLAADDDAFEAVVDSNVHNGI